MLKWSGKNRANTYHDCQKLYAMKIDLDYNFCISDITYTTYVTLNIWEMCSIYTSILLETLIIPPSSVKMCLIFW